MKTFNYILWYENDKGQSILKNGSIDAEDEDEARIKIGCENRNYCDWCIEFK